MAGRRSNGEGSLYQDHDRGGWVGLAYIAGTRRKVRARTKTDVLAKLNRLRADAASGITVDGNTTVRDVLELWRDRVLAGRDLAPSTREIYAWTVPVLIDTVGRKRLAKLTVDDVEKALDRIATGGDGRGNPLSRRSMSAMRSTLAQALDVAVRRRMIPLNPARLAELPPTAARTKPRRALTPHEATRLWDLLDGERLGAMFRLMLLTGLRPGEAGGLCWDAVDLDAGLLTVRRAVRREDGAARVVDELKTAASHRTIGLPVPAVEVLRAQRRVVAELKLAAPSWREGPGGGLVFPTVNGGPWNPSNVLRELGDICVRNDLPRLRPNELRHSAATVLSDRGVPLELIADLLGHTSTRMLDATYRHRVRPAADAAVQVMDDMFGAPGRR